MQLSSRFFLVVLGVVMMLMLWGCQTPAGRSAGQVVDDATITTVVKTKIFDDKMLSGFAISVATFQGEVTLTGAVNSQKEKDQATAVAKSVNGVKSVNNLINLK